MEGSYHPMSLLVLTNSIGSRRSRYHQFSTERINMDYFLIFTLSNIVALFITYSYLIKKAKVITLPALIKGTWIYGTIISMLIVIPYYLYT
jgi:hypothetical protein